jgi:lysophospholipase L1-like esterase
MTIILIFGDSITNGAWDYEEGGWPNRLRKFLDQMAFPSLSSFRVYNLGISGNTTEDVLKRFENECKSRISEIIKYRNEIVIIFQIGLNDTQLVLKKKKIRISYKKFMKNIIKLIGKAFKFTEKIVFIGLTPVEEQKVNPMPWNTTVSYKNDYIKKYNEFLRSVCKENDVYFIEFFDEWIKFNYKILLEDGAHPNPEGHKKMFETIKKFLFKNRII